MATLTPVNVTAVAGTAVTFTAAAAGGDVVASPGPHTWLFVTNGGGAPITVTLAVPGNAWNGVAAPDTAVTVTNATTKAIPVDARYTDSNVQCAVTYSGVTTVTVAAVATG
jgi:hypothetical protein